MPAKLPCERKNQGRIPDFSIKSLLKSRVDSLKFCIFNGTNPHALIATPFKYLTLIVLLLFVGATAVPFELLGPEKAFDLYSMVDAEEKGEEKEEKGEEEKIEDDQFLTSQWLIAELTLQGRLFAGHNELVRNPVCLPVPIPPPEMQA